MKVFFRIRYLSLLILIFFSYLRVYFFNLFRSLISDNTRSIIKDFTRPIVVEAFCRYYISISARFLFYVFAL